MLRKLQPQTTNLATGQDQEDEEDLLTEGTGCRGWPVTSRRASGAARKAAMWVHISILVLLMGDALPAHPLAEGPQV